jgi:DivIVA domain-containing protein
MPTTVSRSPRRDPDAGPSGDRPARGAAPLPPLAPDAATVDEADEFASPSPPARPAFTKVRRGYDVAEVDRYVEELLHRLAAWPQVEVAGTGRALDPADAEQVTPGEGRRRREALEAGTVLLDAREAADRIRTEAEVVAAAHVAEAESEARRLVDEGRADAERALRARREELLAQLDQVENTARRVHAATARIKEQVDEWRHAALQSSERLVASLEHWPAEVPDPTELDHVLSSSRDCEEEAGS